MPHRAPPGPQLHAPLRQRSLLVASHAPQVPTPQAAAVWFAGRRQATVGEVAQQPPAHDAELHTHAPETQVRPAAHAGPVPQPQVPLVQVSLRPVQLWQLPPAAPHAVALLGRHWPAEQHPEGQLVASHPHWFPLQRWPEAHGAPVPQPQVPSMRQVLE